MISENPDIYFRHWGVPAVYAAAGGSPLAVEAIMEHNLDVLRDELGSELQVAAWVRVAQVPQPGRSDTLTVSGTTYRITGRLDGDAVLSLVGLIP